MVIVRLDHTHITQHKAPPAVLVALNYPFVVHGAIRSIYIVFNKLASHLWNLVLSELGSKYKHVMICIKTRFERYKWIANNTF